MRASHPVSAQLMLNVVNCSSITNQRTSYKVNDAEKISNQRLKLFIMRQLFIGNTKVRYFSQSIQYMRYFLYSSLSYDAFIDYLRGSL
ncbi:unknown [Prevotella sp. CAG:891]|nr:unknown [Prevotella sp. CAG:891]